MQVCGALGIYPTISNTISWVSNNIEGVYKRGTTIGLFIGFGNLNSVVSSNIYRQADSPRYFPGHGVVLAYLILFLFGGSVVNYIAQKKANANRAAGKKDYLLEGKTEAEILDLADFDPRFRYTT